MLKHTKMEVMRVDYYDLEAFIREVYGFKDPNHNFSVVAMEEWRNDTEHLFRVKKEPLCGWDQTEFDRWKRDVPKGGHMYVLSAILQDMANNGHIEEGNYLVSVFW